MIRQKKARVCLEIALSFVAILLFLLGMLRIWFWSNEDLFERQTDYIATRSATKGEWPIHNTVELSDSIVFSGEF